MALLSDSQCTMELTCSIDFANRGRSIKSKAITANRCSVQLPVWQCEGAQARVRDRGEGCMLDDGVDDLEFSVGGRRESRHQATFQAIASATEYPVFLQWLRRDGNLLLKLSSPSRRPSRRKCSLRCPGRQW
ncbi:unnamed protein product [Urochloa humidicola]